MEKPREARRTGLVLTRRVGESVMICTSDGDIEVKFNQRSGNYIKLFFCSPETVSVLRKELYDSDAEDSRILGDKSRKP